MAEESGRNRAQDSRRETISALAGEVMGLARDDILMHLRFFAPVLAALPVWERRESAQPEEKEGMPFPEAPGLAWDGHFCLYDPVSVLVCYGREPGLVARTYLHLLLHCAFSHQFQYDKLDADIWDLAADLAVEDVILELGLGGTALAADGAAARRFRALKEQAGALTAEKLYRYFQKNPPSPEEMRELRMFSFRDSHRLWKRGQPSASGAEQWRKLGRQMKTELQSFARGKAGTRSLEKNLEEADRERYDYGEILRRFAVLGEELTVSREEFDYIYYTYGLEHYGNLPLIEPLEYRESRKVREFVIAIDTSASCDGEAVKAFLRKTYTILNGFENFFTRINVHILQCDNRVQDDRKLTCREDLETFLREGKLTGFGATDFRPVFQYVEKLRERGEFENLKGLIYFTDGYGIYPERAPDYQTVFAFLEEDENRAPVPPWSIKAVVGQ